MGLVTADALLFPDPDAFLPIKAGCHGSVTYEPGRNGPGDAALRSRVRAGEPVMTIIGDEIAARQTAFLNLVSVLPSDACEVDKKLLHEIGMSEGQIAHLVRRGTPSRLLRLTWRYDVAVDHVLPAHSTFGPGDRLYSFTRWEDLVLRFMLPQHVADGLDYRMPARVTPARWRGEPVRGAVTRKDHVGDGAHVWVTVKLAQRSTFPEDERCRIEITAPRLAQDHPPPVGTVVRVTPEVDPSYRNRLGLTAQDLEDMKQRGGRGGALAKPEYKREQVLAKAEQEARHRTAPPLARMKPAEKSRVRDTGFPPRQLTEAQWAKAQVRTTTRQARTLTPQLVVDVLLSHDPAELDFDPDLAEAAQRLAMDGDPGAGEARRAGAVLFASCLVESSVFDKLSGGWLELAFKPAMGERFRARGPMFAARCGVGGHRRVRFGLALPAGWLRIEGKRRVEGAILSDPDGTREVLAVPRCCLALTKGQAVDGPEHVVAVHAKERELAFVRVRIGLESQDFVEIEPAIPLRKSEAIVYDLNALDSAILQLEAGEKDAKKAADWLRYRANLNRTDRRS